MVKKDTNELRKQEPPVKIGEEYDLQVESFGTSGDAICKIEDYAIIIKSPRKPPVGEIISVRINKVFENYAFAGEKEQNS